MTPTKLGRFDPRTNKQYVHIYTKEEQRKIITAELEGKTQRSVIQEIIASLKDEDWQEVE